MGLILIETGEKVENWQKNSIRHELSFQILAISYDNSAFSDWGSEG
jgi:hypothetical protein